jgi:hypothetical protein
MTVTVAVAEQPPVTPVTEKAVAEVTLLRIMAVVLSPVLQV